MKIPEEKKDDLEVVDAFSVDIYKEPDNQISLQVSLGKVTMSDGTIYTFSQSGTVISVTPEKSMAPRLSVNIGNIVTHMASLLHKKKVN